MDAQTTAIVNAPTFAAAVEATLTFWAQTGDRRTRAFKAESARLSQIGANALRKVSTESGVRNLGVVQDVVTAAAHVARDAR